MNTVKTVEKVLNKNFYYKKRNPKSVEEIIKKLQDKGIWK